MSRNISTKVLKYAIARNIVKFICILKGYIIFVLHNKRISNYFCVILNSESNFIDVYTFIPEIKKVNIEKSKYKMPPN